jgi:hypothetical protein
MKDGPVPAHAIVSADPSSAQAGELRGKATYSPVSFILATVLLFRFSLEP